MRRGAPAAAVTAVLAVVVGFVLTTGWTGAAWVKTDVNAGNTFTTGTWASALSIWGWGANGRTGVLMPAVQTTTAVRMVGPESWATVSGGQSSTCGLTTTQDLYCWGENTYGQLGDGTSTNRWEPVPVMAGTAWSSVSKGYVDTCAIKAADASVWCWGYNPDGEVGNGTTASPVTSPVQVSTTGVTTWSTVSVGQYYSCGLKTDKTLWCWGYNANGRLGDGTTTSRSMPVQVGSGTWKFLATGNSSACAIKNSDSSLWCWGKGALGQLGNNATTDQPTPVAVNGGGTWSAVSPGTDHACGLKTDGTIWCWGYGGYGDLGRGSTTDSSVPVQESTNSTAWTTLASYNYGTCALRTGGQLYCWGDNGTGEIGDGSTTSRQTPVASGTDTTWTQLGGGGTFFCGVRADNGVWCQGYDGQGQLGHYYNNQVGSPTAINGPNASWATGSVGYDGGCGVRNAGSLWCWGDNTYGSAGQGDTATDYDYAVQVGSSTAWRQVSFGTWAVCAIQSDASLWCWGTTTYKQTGVSGATGSISTPTAGPAGSWSSVSVGETHTCGVKADASLWCWGDNGSGQIGIGSTTDQATPAAVTVAGVTGWSSVSAGYYTTCAVAASGTTPGALYCWGRNAFGQVGNNSTTNATSPVRVGSATWSEVSAGRSTTCGRQTGGSIWCWGINDYGELGGGGAAGTPASVPTPQQVGSATTWTHVVTGWGFSCGTKADATVWCWGRDDDGELGDRGSATVTTPQQVPGITSGRLEAHAGARTVLSL